jgi:hypothetical protein
MRVRHRDWEAGLLRHTAYRGVAWQATRAADRHGAARTARPLC